MGMFSKLFGGSSRDKHSYVRIWSKNKEREIDQSNDLPMEELLFATSMWILSTFGDENSKDIVPKEMKGFVLDASQHYSGDATLFELGCYLYLQLDLWLFMNRPKRREVIVTDFADKFIELFTHALNIKDIAALFDERLCQYSKLSREGANTENYHYHLLQLIIRTRDNQLPASYDFEKHSLTIRGFTEETGLKFALVSWEKSKIPVLFDTVEKYCDLTG
ncbi:MAG TPA: hypothetical protein DIU00_07250 [Phycisphaerales bacterium]|nr:hypothetical protein [Phycisphaerales bacterium]